MAGRPPSSGIIPPTTPDSQVPAERVETSTIANQKKRRVGRFLKGPIPLSWVRCHIHAPADRLILVLRAYADMSGSPELRVSADILRDANVEDRKVLYRALKALEKSGSVEVLRNRGRRPVVRIRV